MGIIEMSCAPYWPGTAGSLTFQQLQYTPANKELTLTPYGNTVTLSGFVESVAAGSNISVTGTALNPTINMVNNSSYQQLGNYSGTATGPNASQPLTTLGGASNIPVTPGGVYAVYGGRVTIESQAAGTDFGFTFYVNNGSQDADFVLGSSAQYKSGGIFYQIPFPLNTTIFIAQSSNVQLYVSNGNGASPTDYTQVNVTTPQLIRIL